MVQSLIFRVQASFISSKPHSSGAKTLFEGPEHHSEGPKSDVEGPEPPL